MNGIGGCFDRRVFHEGVWYWCDYHSLIIGLSLSAQPIFLLTDSDFLTVTDQGCDYGPRLFLLRWRTSWLPHWMPVSIISVFFSHNVPYIPHLIIKEWSSGGFLSYSTISKSRLNEHKWMNTVKCLSEASWLCRSISLWKAVKITIWM